MGEAGGVYGFSDVFIARAAQWGYMRQSVAYAKDGKVNTVRIAVVLATIRVRRQVATGVCDAFLFVRGSLCPDD